MMDLEPFNADHLRTVNEASALAEELVSNAYKMSASQWLEPRREIKTLAQLGPEEIMGGPEAPFAQVIRYQGRTGDSSLTSSTFDFYTICLQDHAILAALRENPALGLLPFSVYILTHELIHIVRFSLFEQYFDAPALQRQEEEIRVHIKTLDILSNSNIARMDAVLRFYQQWHRPLDSLRNHE
jgi:hypothetical protein